MTEIRRSANNVLNVALIGCNCWAGLVQAPGCVWATGPLLKSRRPVVGNSHRAALVRSGAALHPGPSSAWGGLLHLALVLPDHRSARSIMVISSIADCMRPAGFARSLTVMLSTCMTNGRPVLGSRRSLHVCVVSTSRTFAQWRRSSSQSCGTTKCMNGRCKTSFRLTPTIAQKRRFVSWRMPSGVSVTYPEGKSHRLRVVVAGVPSVSSIGAVLRFAFPTGHAARAVARPVWGMSADSIATEVGKPGHRPLRPVPVTAVLRIVASV